MPPPRAIFCNPTMWQSTRHCQEVLHENTANRTIRLTLPSTASRRRPQSSKGFPAFDLVFFCRGPPRWRPFFSSCEARRQHGSRFRVSLHASTSKSAPMNYYALLYELSTTCHARVPFREEHLCLPASHANAATRSRRRSPNRRPRLARFYVDDKSKVKPSPAKTLMSSTVSSRNGSPPLERSRRQRATSFSSVAKSKPFCAAGPHALPHRNFPSISNTFPKCVARPSPRPGYLGATVSTRRLQDEVEVAVETTALLDPFTISPVPTSSLRRPRRAAALLTVSIARPHSELP